MTKNGGETLCLYDNLWHPSNSSCPRWVEFSHSLSRSQRLQIAMNLHTSEDAERRHQEGLKNSKMDRDFEVKKMILSFLGGILATLIAQLIISLWK